MAEFGEEKENTTHKRLKKKGEKNFISPPSMYDNIELPGNRPKQIFSNLT